MRCHLIPILKAKHRHHTTYRDFGRDRDAHTIPLSPLAHWLIHGVLGGSIWMPKAVTRQNKTARALGLPWLLGYPNPLQRIAHAWCRVVGVMLWLEQKTCCR